MNDNVVILTLRAANHITNAKRADSTTSTEAMPTLSDPNAYTTPSVSVPPNNNNPYIIRQSNPAGTVFIAVVPLWVPFC